MERLVTACLPSRRIISINHLRAQTLSLQPRAGLNPACVSLADRDVQTAKRSAAEALLSQVYVSNTPLENVYSFEYLGARMQCDGADDADVRHRMAIAQTTFGSLSSIWTDHRLSRALKLRTYQLAVCSTLTHASEAWTLTEPVMRSVNGFNSRCLHIITGQDYRVTATAPEYDLLLAIRQRRLRYLGHILRMPESRVVRSAYHEKLIIYFKLAVISCQCFGCDISPPHAKR